MRSTQHQLAIAAVAVVLLITSCAIGQRRYQLIRPCPATITPAVVEIQRDGDIDLVPCSGRSVFINGNPTTGLINSLNGLTAASQTFAVPIANDTASWSSAVSTHTLRLPITAVSGSSRTNFFPYFDAANTLAKSPFSFSGSLYTWDNPALAGTFIMTFSPSATGEGTFRLGNLTGTIFEIDEALQNFTFSTAGADAQILINGNSNQINLNADASIEISSPAVNLGRLDVDGVVFEVDDAASSFTFSQNDVEAATVSFANSIARFTFFRTITAGGTTGNQTINRPVGTVNFAAAAAALTVTNSTVSATSIVLAVARTNDATCSVKNIVPGAGSFVINMTAACTAETSVGFLVLN